MNARKKVVKPRVTSECRVDGHMWMPHDGGKKGRGFFRVLKCGRGCKVLRHQELNKDGEITKQWYEYTDAGYLVKGGRLTQEEKGAIRLLHVNGNLGNVVAFERKKA